MGYWKDRMISQQEQGWHFVDDSLYVCAECFDDDAITQFIEDNASEQECNYCGEHSEVAIATSMNSVLEIIGDAVRSGYEDPANSLPVEGGEYLFPTMDIEDVLDEVGWPTQSDPVTKEIRDAFHGSIWVRKNFFGLREDEQLRYGWGDFVEEVKHKTRYLFSLERPPDSPFVDDSIPPHKMLNHIGKAIEDVGLIRTVMIGSQWLRARIHDFEESYSSASELGTVPQDKAIYANRMSPAGIPMFYGAIDEATAIAETYMPKSGRKAVATVGTFKTARDIQILDLTNLPPMPSFFDQSNRHLRPAISFLRDFVKDLTKPINKDGREHIDYVPTQIVTEYFRHVFQTPASKGVKGILYFSSQVHTGTCCVLFFNEDHCCDATGEWDSDPEKWLGLIQVTRKNLE